MKTSKRVLSLLLALVLVCSLLPLTDTPARASDLLTGTCGDSLTWTLDRDTGLMRISGTGYMTNWTDKTNSTRPPWYLSRSTIRTVVIENGAKSVGNYAFEDCVCLEAVSLCETLSEIGDYSFRGCTYLTDISIPVKVVSIGAHAFDYCLRLTDLSLPLGVTDIGSYAFHGSGLTSFNVPTSVTSIGEQAFSNCGALQSFTMSGSVNCIEGATFAFCSNLTSFTVPSGVTSIGNSVFFLCSRLTGISLPDSLTSIGSSAFFGCSALTGIAIPAGVSSIGESAFYSCSSLASFSVASGNQYFSSDEYGVLFNKDQTKLLRMPAAFSGVYDIPEGTRTIENEAFQSCSALKTLSIPASLTSIGDGFNSCDGLARFTVASGNRFYSTDDNGFLFDRMKTTLIRAPQAFSGAFKIPETVVQINAKAFSRCACLTSVTIPDSVAVIGEEAFRACAVLTDVTIQGDVGEIPAGAFRDCKHLCSVTISEGVQRIEQNAFQECTALASLELPASVTYIGEKAFYKCSSLANIVMRNGVTGIDEEAFYDCRSLKTVGIPGTVTMIGEDAFGCYPAISNFTILGLSGSAAQTYAQDNGFRFQAVTNCYFGEHEYTFSVKTAPNEKSPGALKGVCSVCGDSVTISLPVLNAVDYDYTVVSPATCTTPGAAQYVWKTTDYGTYSFESILNATGHSYTAVVTAPKCEEQGYTTYICVHGDSQYIADYTNPTGHAWDAGVVTTQPTETSSGTRTYTCQTCGQTKTEVIPPYEHVHSYVPTVYLPTCMNSGYTRYDCSCGSSYTDNYVAATGHSFAYEIEKTPNLFETGSLKGVCPRDNAVISIVLPNLNDTDYTWTVTVPATCTTMGTQRFTWKETAYGEYYFDLTILPLGHDYVQGVCNRCGIRQDDPNAPFPFIDVKESAYYFIPVRWAVNRGIASGTSATTFGPKATCTRAQVMTFLWSAAGSPEPATTENPFTDVKPTSYYYKAVLWAVENNIATGTSPTTFGPKGTCTRAQIVTFLWNYCGSPEPLTTENPFTDVKPSSYYYKAVLWAYENDVTTGTSPTTFAPKATCTRAQVVTFLWKALT